MPAFEFTPEWEEDVRSCYRRGALGWSRDLADDYDALVRQAVRDVIGNPMRHGSKARPDLGQNVRIWPIAKSKGMGRPGGKVRDPRHYVVYEFAADREMIVFLRLLRGAGLVPQLVPLR